MINKRLIQVIFCFFFLFHLTDVYPADDDRQGFILGAGIGVGYSNVFASDPLFEGYSTCGLGITMGLGYAPTNKSSIIFGIKSNVFVDEVAVVWKDWNDKMSGDDLSATGAKLVAPFVFMFSPVFRSHSIFGSLEYTYFTREYAPSLLFSGSVGVGLLYDKFYEQSFGGFGFSLGTGYEFFRKVAVNCDLVYSYTENDIQAISILITLKKYFY